MATNVYPMEQLIYFGSVPSKYYGYYVSTSSHTAGCADFSCAGTLHGYQDAVKELTEGTHADPHDVAGLAALAYGGDSDDDKDFGHELLKEALEEVRDDDRREEIYEKLERIFSDWQVMSKEDYEKGTNQVPARDG